MLLHEYNACVTTHMVCWKRFVSITGGMRAVSFSFERERYSYRCCVYCVLVRGPGDGVN